MDKKVFFFLFFLCLTISPAWGSTKIVASIFPLYSIAKDVSSPYAKVYLLLPPGADPHSWEPTPKDMVLLSQADLILVIDKGLEPWFEDMKKAFLKKRQKLFIVTDAAPLLYKKGVIDPHIWLDFKWDIQITRKLAQILAEIDPQNKDFYEKKAQKLEKAFLALDKEYQKTLLNCRSKTLVVAGHAAFGYWVRNYGLKMESLAALSPEAEPTPKVIAQMISFIKRNKIHSIFYEHLASKRLAEILAQETGTKILYLSPGASLSQEELDQGISFLDLMKRDLEVLKKGLSCY